jgi:predicted nucleotidyltransferase
MILVGLNIPKTGITIPNMGARSKPSRRSLADALFSSTQQRVLGFLFGQPERSFFATELIKLVGAGSGAVQRELARLEQSGLVSVTHMGNRKHYQANPHSPIFQELCDITRKTVGLAEPLREALEPLASRISAAFVFGSVAEGSDTAASDIDVIVLSDSIDYADVFEALQPAEARLARRTNPTIYSQADWRKKRDDGNAFVVKVSARPKVFLIGAEDALG